jgi:hypothetical protein
VRKRFGGGSSANEQLTAIVAAVLLPLLAADGVTLLNIRALMTVHAFVGMLLVPVVAVKMMSTGWRMLGYYRGRGEYVLRGPPHLLLRALVAPVVVASTIVLFGTGIVLLIVNQTHGTIVGLHKASFIVWFGSVSVHVLVRLPALVAALRLRLPGLSLRLGAVAVALVAGASLATLTLPAIDHLQDGVSGQVGFDDG